MGAASSQSQNAAVPFTNHSALPQDTVPYPGPAIEYRQVEVTSKLKAHMSFGFTAGQQVTTSDIQSFYGLLQQQYAEYYQMDTFYQVPLAMSRAGFSSVHIPFQGIFSRPTVYIPSNQKWQLLVEQSAIQLSVVRSGSLFLSGQNFDVAIGDIFSKISAHSQKGGRLICMECSGNVTSQGMSFTQSPFFGVDIFFDIPQHPEPTLYSYTAFSTPMFISYGSNSVDIQCDYQGTLAQHLDKGWKLVDIFIGQNEVNLPQSDERRYRPTQMNTIWFFEKESQRLEDPTPRYQVTFVEYYLHASSGGFSGNISASLQLGPMLQEMGQSGWQLVCVLDTPSLRLTGFGKATRGVVIFFQRPIIAAPGMASQYSAVPPSGVAQAPAGVSASTANPPPSYSQIAELPEKS